MSPLVVPYSSMIFFFAAASIDTPVLLSVSRCAAPPVPVRAVHAGREWELFDVRGRSNGALKGTSEAWGRPNRGFALKTDRSFA